MKASHTLQPWESAGIPLWPLTVLSLIARRQTDNPLEPERYDETWEFHSRNVVQLIRECGVDFIETENNLLFAVAGGPMLDDSDTEKILDAAIKIREYARQVQADETTTNYYVKIGLHTDKVIAGIIDAARMPFDLYAHALHMANRMARICNWGEINLSQYTHDYVGDAYNCDYWGSIDAMGEIHKPSNHVFKKAVKNRPSIRRDSVKMYKVRG
ncbi:MAG: adenylate/guanylate cyclase domain-containing protein [Flavobacteriales bacterium]|nr:adenylate/guanylate cyclase domain-containing protein [Flavobacteriales bacterium]